MDNPAQTADYIIDFLNDLLEKDSKAISALFDGYRVKCNNELANHQSVQVSQNEDGVYSVGILGILNGIVGTIADGNKVGWGYITMIVEDDGSISKFQRTT